MIEREETPLMMKQGSGDDAKEPETGSATLGVFIEILENVLDWSPFISVQILGSGTYVLSTAFLVGTLAAAFVIVYSFLRSASSSFTHTFTPKILDVGQLVLFGSLYILALISNNAGKYTSYLQQLLFLWFNALTTGGMGLIMWTSVLNGKPFVFDYAKVKMPPALYDKLISKNWFRKKLTEVAMFWVKILGTMTIIVTIQPLLVTIFYSGNPKNDPSGFMALLGLWLTIGQIVILSCAMFYSAQKGRANEIIKKRVRLVKENGLSKDERQMYGDAIFLDNLDVKNHCIKTLRNNEQLDLAAEVLTEAFSNDDMTNGLMRTKEEKLNFFKANLKAYAVFNHVFGCFNKFTVDNATTLTKPSCVMVCVPVFSKRREEIEVFNSFPAWIEHGFEMSSADEFPIPDDDLMECSELKKKKENGLLGKPYIYIAFFGSDSQWKGKGFGRSLLKYVIELSEQKQVPLVLETSTDHNRKNYAKYGFQTIDHVKARPDWVLMVRIPGQQTSRYGTV
ncbi:hypothetical protein CTEN210_16364 [Chaetoceros tenuissimus]|uniref:N-acetyltransferase domain-containing protein n=1 Tax=Chaetoceros tenuissimus TaxID=426638 RepID=A0AAD3D8Q6_9STRA|nr:hypothetical protein CTEN210_16364 [Chaetoceros tenuissimus]